MASYTANQLSGAGIPTEVLSGSKTFAITSSGDQITYFTMETVRDNNGFYNTSSATNALGVYSNFVSIDVDTLVTSSYITSVVVGVGRGSFDFNPTTAVSASGSFLRGTGGITLTIS